jgi:hypothetical protein
MNEGDNHERKLNTINENPQMTQMAQIFYL